MADFVLLKPEDHKSIFILPTTHYLDVRAGNLRTFSERCD
jgi:hypothetical protein